MNGVFQEYGNYAPYQACEESNGFDNSLFVADGGWNKTEHFRTSPQKRHYMQVDQLESVGFGK